LDPQGVESQLCKSSDPKVNIELNEDNTCQEDVVNDQNHLFGDTFDDDDSASSYDDDYGDPMNTDNVVEDQDDAQDDNKTISL